MNNESRDSFMAQIFDRSSNALARMGLVLSGLIVIALGVTLDELQRSPWVTRQGQRAEQPVPFSHKHHVQGLGLQCQYCHTTVEKSSYAGIPPTRTCMNCHAQIWTNAQLLEPVRQSWATGESIPWIKIHDLPEFEKLPEAELDCPIQQGLANEDPDVDAIYRLLLPLPICFRTDRRLALGRGTWCPFNSQNTAWFPAAYPLMYLPSYCSFRMTDIWRSFVAQRIAWENGWSVLFKGPDVYQQRNEHNLMKDFSDEISGYLNNRKIGTQLDALKLEAGPENLGANLIRCYEELVRLELVGGKEMDLVKAWVMDLESF